MAATRADKEAHDPAPAEETILVARGQLPQARAEDLAKKEEAGDNKMTSDQHLASDLMEQLTVSDRQEAAEDQDSMMGHLLDLHHLLVPQHLLDLTADQLVTDSPVTTILEEAMVKMLSTDHQKQDQVTTGPLNLEAVPITDPQDLPTIDPLDLEEILTTDLLDLEEMSTIVLLDLEEIPILDPLDWEEIPIIDPLDLEEIPIIGPLNLEEIPTIDLLDLEEISMKGQEIMDQLTLADLLDLQIGLLD